MNNIINIIINNWYYIVWLVIGLISAIIRKKHFKCKCNFKNIFISIIIIGLGPMYGIVLGLKRILK